MIIEGTYRKNIFFNSEKGLSTFWLKPKEGTLSEYVSENGMVKIVGKFCLHQRYMPLKIEGDCKITDYGYEFHIDHICEGNVSIPEMEQFLTEIGTGVSQKTIKKILRATGGNVFAAAAKDNIEVEICEKTGAEAIPVMNIFSKIRKLITELKLFQTLDRFNGSYEHCTKILKKYPDNAIQMLLENPYEILEHVNIPFTLIDQIALSNGAGVLSERRIQAVILWCMRNETNKGHSYVTQDALCKAVSKVYGDIPATAVVAILGDYPYIVRDEVHKDYYYERNILKDETLAAREFARLMYSRIELPYRPQYIDAIEKERGYAFGAQQKSAFYLLQTTGIKLLTGDPGTGKTTTVNGLLNYLEIVWEETFGRAPVFALCAPAGRAAQRMKETTKRNAQTIHKLLEYQPYGNSEYYKNENDPIEADVVVVDEVSMLGISTFSKLLAAIKNGSLVILVGDTNQLQSVEPGNVLQDIINSGYVDSCHLTEVFRQAEESLININAKKVINGEEDLKEGSDFQIIRSLPGETQNVLQNSIASLYAECGNKNKIQVLAPIKKGSCGVKEGNRLIQNLFNPEKGGIWYGYKNLKIKDRVIMLSNNYEAGYYNGDVGYISYISDSSVVLEIGEEKLTLEKEAFADMDLAYNCTVHKSQGSEYEYLIIVLQEEGKGMLDQNLLYTAITRGKKKVVLIYENETLSKAIRTSKKGTRNSLLAERIHQYMRIL